MHLAHLWRRLRDGGEDPARLAGVAARLADAPRELAELRQELRYAKTTEQREAFEALERKLEGTHDDEQRSRIRWYREPMPAPRLDAPIRLP